MFQASWVCGTFATKVARRFLVKQISLMGSSCSSKSRAMASDNSFQVCAGKVEDFGEGQMKEIKVDNKSLLIIKHRGKINAMSSKCTHYGAPLIKGSFCSKDEGTIRCPWHGACFNASTGDIEDFPGLDSLKKFDVEIKDGKVFVRDQVVHDKTTKFPVDVDQDETVVIVGGGGAAQVCAETLRSRKNYPWKGKIVMITQENNLPYDRPKLSKAMSASGKDLQLRQDIFFQNLNIETLLGVKVTGVDTNAKTLSLKGDRHGSINYTHLVLATGGSPRSISSSGSDLANILYLRSPQDANAIVEGAKDKKVVIVGSSFIGTEVAAFLSDKAESVTIIGRTKYPLERSLGPEVGELVRSMHEAKGVRFVGNANVLGFKGQDGRVASVMIDNPEESIPADLVVVGIGCVPATQFLLESDVILDGQGYVEVNQHLETNVPNVYAVGDIAKFPLSIHQESPRVAIGHWQIAQSHGRLAGLNIGQETKELVRTVPFFWTVQYGKSFRYSGYCPSWDDIVYDGQVSSGSFVAYYCLEDCVQAVATLGKDPIAADFANLLKSGKRLLKKDAVAGLWRQSLSTL